MWKHGIVVVVSAGNDGTDASRLTNPATDPFVLAVGASDTNGSADANDDSVADFSSRGDLTRRPDVVVARTLDRQPPCAGLAGR